MRVLLRSIALLAGLSVVATIVFLARFGRLVLPRLLGTGTFGVITLIGWAVTFIVGPFAMVQLFRLKHSGRIAAALLFGCMLAYYSVGIVAFRQSGVAIAPLVLLCVLLASLVFVVLSPAAKRTCTVASATRKLTEP